MKILSRSIFLVIALAPAWLTKPVKAKGPVDLITIEGPGISMPIEITDAAILERFDPWTGRFIGTGGPLIGPPVVKDPYLVKFYVENQPGDLILRYMFYYYFNQGVWPAGGTGYLYLPGPGEPYYQTNTGTINRGTSDGHWHKALPAWDDVMTESVQQPQTRYSVVRGLILAFIGGALLGAGVLFLISQANRNRLSIQPNRVRRTMPGRLPRSREDPWSRGSRRSN